MEYHVHFDSRLSAYSDIHQFFFLYLKLKCFLLGFKDIQHIIIIYNYFWAFAQRSLTDIES